MVKQFQSLPNILTFIRLGLIPLFVILLIEPTDSMRYAAATVFLVAALTDYLDGLVARRLGAVSDFGKLLDPLADKILVMAALVMLVAQRGELTGRPWVPGWLVVLLMTREIWITGLRAVAAKAGHVIAASNPGKIKSGLQMTAIILLLVHEPGILIGEYKLTLGFIGLQLLLISVVVSYWSAVEYTKEILFQKN